MKNKKLIKSFEFINFYQNKRCPFFPCHHNISANQFNCKFCYCPLFLVPNCGGNYVVLEDGTKDCSKCIIPHTTDGPQYILEVLRDLYNK